MRTLDRAHGWDLVVTAAYVDEGPTMKRFRPRAQGRASRILKRVMLQVTPKQQMLLAMERPTSGKLLLAGQDLSKISNAQIPFLRRQIGVVFQNHQLLFDRTVFDNVALPLRELQTLDEALIRELVFLKLRLVGLEPHVGAMMPSELSGGMVKRASLARALALEPELLFLDDLRP